MNPAIKDQWVAALTSGKYKQTQDALNSNGEFCCLGVLCDLHSQATNTKWTVINRLDGKPNNYYLHEFAALPYSVMKWAEVSCDYANSVTINGRKDRLDNHNDSGRTFVEIAKAIKEQL